MSNIAIIPARGGSKRIYCHDSVQLPAAAGDVCQ